MMNNEIFDFIFIFYFNQISLIYLKYTLTQYT